MSQLLDGSERIDPVCAVVSIVHELRTPLATIHAGADLLVQSSGAQPYVHRVARNLHHASVRMRELLDEFFDRVRGVGDESQSVAVSPLASKRPSDTSEVARGIRELVNLLLSAADAIANGATIRLSGVSRNGSVFIEVRESGLDNAAEIRGRLFEPSPASSLGQGFGLLWRALIDLGGEIWAESSGPNARFTIRLPQKTARPGAAS